MLNFIFGAGGFARELDWLIEEIYRYYHLDYRPLNYIVSDLNKQVPLKINGKVVISESDFFRKHGADAMNCFLGIGDPAIKRNIRLKLKQTVKRAEFPNLRHPSVLDDKRDSKVSFGEGNIICSNTIITTDVTISDFVTINLACTVGHDCSIGHFVTISPGVNLSGRVSLGSGVFIGTGTRIIEGIHVTSDTVIGAGATVVRNIDTPGTYVGTPARMIK
jgi:sugar O-acyltransferase (sialic acid O-acetyltransferase NeuD family)